MIIYPYKRIPDKVTLSVPSGWGIGRSDTGWMTAEVFYDFIANCFYKELLEKKIQLPVVLFVDGHKTHITMEVSELCRSLQIHLIALYPNATRILQPAHVAAFRPIKVAWKKALHEWYAGNNHQVSLTKEKFAPLLKKVVASCAKPETLINGFRICGLHPFQPDNVDYSKCIAKQSTSDDTIPSLPEAHLRFLSYADFCDTIGAWNVNQGVFDGHLNIELETDDFLSIYMLWKKFNASSANNHATFGQSRNGSIHEDNDMILHVQTSRNGSIHDNVILDDQTGKLKGNVKDSLEIHIENQETKKESIIAVSNSVDQQALVEVLPGPSRPISRDKLITV